MSQSGVDEEKKRPSVKELVAYWDTQAREKLSRVSASLGGGGVVPRRKPDRDERRGARRDEDAARVQKAAEPLKKSNFGAAMRHGLRTLAEASRRARRNLAAKLARLAPSRHVAAPSLGGEDAYEEFV